jgi:hypothetical protein
MIKPDNQQPSLGRNPNRVERWESVNAKKTTSNLSSSSRQTGVWHSESERDALKTGVWNPSRQREAAPSGNIWVLLAIVTVCSLSSFALFQSLLGPRLANRPINARINTAPRALPPAVTRLPENTSTQNASTQNASSQPDEVAASAVTFDSASATGTTNPVQTQASASSTLVETTPKTSSLPANQIQLSQIDSIAESGGQPLLRFKDGSSLNVDAFTLQQLPSDVRLRISYSRGRDGP